MSCINKQSLEYEDLKRSSTLSSNVLDAYCLTFQDKHGRMPKLDEIPGSDSSQFLKEELKVNKLDSVSNERLLKFTGAETVKDAVINLNNHYLDTEIKAIDLGETSILKIKKRPDVMPKEIETYYTPDMTTGNDVIIQGLEKLRTLYGYDVREVTSFELESEQWKDLMPGNKLVNAFIYNGNIYINVDNMTPDSRVHEMLHLLVGSIRFTNPELYSQLLQSTMQIQNIETLMQIHHSDKTRNDALEEIFVSELAKKLVGIESKLDNLSSEQLYEINYNVKRVLDTLLEGDYSTKIISDDILYKMTLEDVAEEVNSSKLTNTFFGTYNQQGSEVHRKLSTMKQDLLKKYDLLEFCD